jgi:hypothetical protein
MSNMNTTQKKNWGYRLFAVLLIAVCALSIAVLEFCAIYSVPGLSIKSGSLLTIAKDMFASKNNVLGFLPSFEVSGTAGVIYTLSIYLFLLGIAVSAILALVAIFNGKNAPKLVRTSVFYMTAGALLYTFAFSLSVECYIANNLFGAETAVNANFPIAALSNSDTISLVLGIAGLVIAWILAGIKIGKVAALHFLQALLTVAFVGLLSQAVAKSNALVSTDAEQLVKILAIVGVVVMFVNALISLGRMPKEGGIIFDLVRYILVTIVGLLLIAKIGATTLGILAAIVVVLQVVIVIIQLVNAHKKQVEDVKEEATQEATSGFHMEEYVEAYPYEGGPVAGVLMAEEVNPSFLPHEPHVNTAGYDFYNCKSFDPFIATLDTAERNEFTELFILKFKGTMPELPDYNVGGDNKEFFRKLFIYLGQYRDRISQPLLAKMYQYSMKI